MRRPRRPVRAVAACAALLLAAGCGGGGGDVDALTVYAAASLADVLPVIEPAADYSFAASDTLATQLREGAPADVYAAANERLPSALLADGIVERPVVFATNRLVLLVQKGNPKAITGVADLGRPGITFLMADRGVPVGDYTRTVLWNLGAGDLVGRAASQEDDVRAVTGKVALGEADAGFAYVTDARAVAEDVEAVAIGRGAQPPVRYAVAVVASSTRKARAAALIAKLRGPDGRRALRDAGFGLP